MELIPNELRQRLLQNGRLQVAVKGTPAELDFIPVVKLFTPDADCIWLLTELDPEDPDIAFGLCDLGMGFPELGSVSLEEINSVRRKLGIAIICDPDFAPGFTISVYAHAARIARCIVEDRTLLERAAIALRNAERADGGAS